MYHILQSISCTMVLNSIKILSAIMNYSVHKSHTRVKFLGDLGFVVILEL